MAIPHVAPPAPLEIAAPPLPIDDSDGGCDTAGDKFYKAWTREHAALRVASGDRQEIGTRMALGAMHADVLKLFLRQGLVLTTIGLGLGLAGALCLTRWLASLLYGVRPNDPISFAVASLLLLLVGLAATYLPARRATRIDPMAALRYE